MAQHDHSLANQSGQSFRADLNNGLAAIVSNNSGASEPSTMYAYQWWANTTTGSLLIRNAANNNWVTVGTLASPNLGLLASGGTLTAAAGSAGTPSITFTGATSDTGIYSPGTDQVAIATAGTQRLLIDASGNINIDSNTLYVDATNNRVGIGTAVPSERLFINDSGTSAAISIRTGGASLNSVIKFNADDTNYANIGLENTALVMRCSNSSTPTERARIDSSGRLLVGTVTAAASEMLNVTGSVASFHTRFLNSNAAPFGLLLSYTGAAPNGTGNAFLRCDDTTAERATIRSNGGLANYSANNVNLSDRNAKKDIAPAADTWDCLKEWEIVNFRYKDQPDDADLNLGVIAQQVAESCPEVITVFQETKEATDDQPAQEERIGVKEQQMMWMAIKALQEAQLRIETLEAEVAALKGS